MTDSIRIRVIARADSDESSLVREVKKDQPSTVNVVKSKYKVILVIWLAKSGVAAVYGGPSPCQR